MSQIPGTLMPFLYPCLLRPVQYTTRNTKTGLRFSRALQTSSPCRQSLSETNAARRAVAFEPAVTSTVSRLDPTPDDYSRSLFVDKCTVTVHAGSGGNGCVAFFRDAFVPDGPPNGGDGGSGGSVWIQAVSEQTSLHKLARRGIVKAGRGIGGQGKSQGGRKGEDVCIQVPVGTVVREVWRSDPLAEEEQQYRELVGNTEDPGQLTSRNKWILYPGASTSEAREVTESLPPPLKPRRSHLSVMEPSSPVTLDLDKPMEKPVLLAAGAVGGLGNPHFATRDTPKPKFATKGELGVRLKLELELKLLADVGLVGLPNAGKSTLLRAISNSRTRVGNWAFTTLEPTIGTVVLDNNEGRPLVSSGIHGQPPRTSISIADIPGLIEDAHLDKGLGLGFLRHIERARILAFVIDLSAGDAVLALKNLWKEVGEYENLRNRELNEQSEERVVEWNTFSTFSPASPSGNRKPSQPILDDTGEAMTIYPSPSGRSLEPLVLPPLSSKPWFIVATKADKEGTQDEFVKLQNYVDGVESGDEDHPSGRKNAWKNKIAVIPVSAIRGEGTERIGVWAAGVLDSMEVGSGSGNGTGMR